VGLTGHRTALGRCCILAWRSRRCQPAIYPTITCSYIEIARRARGDRGSLACADYFMDLQDSSMIYRGAQARSSDGRGPSLLSHVHHTSSLLWFGAGGRRGPPLGCVEPLRGCFHALRGPSNVAAIEWPAEDCRRPAPLIYYDTLGLHHSRHSEHSSRPSVGMCGPLKCPGTSHNSVLYHFPTQAQDQAWSCKEFARLPDEHLRCGFRRPQVRLSRGMSIIIAPEQQHTRLFGIFPGYHYTPKVGSV
jgi:hypothetical protein